MSFSKPKTKKERSWPKSEGKLTVDVYETEDSIVIRAAIAGIETDDLDISVEDDIVEIKGKREKPKEEEKFNYFLEECYWGPFSREIILPKEVDSSKVKASMKTGILTITLPKTEKEEKRKIRLKKKK